MGVVRVGGVIRVGVGHGGGGDVGGGVRGGVYGQGGVGCVCMVSGGGGEEVREGV